MIDLFTINTKKGFVKLMKLRNPWGKVEWKGDWSDRSYLWTDALRNAVGGHSVADDGIFFMAYEDFIWKFKATSLCANADPDRYEHKQSIYDFYHTDHEQSGRSFGKELAFYEMELTKEIDCTKNSFAITVSQHGDKLGTHRLNDEKLRYDEILCTILLIDNETGCLVKAINDWRFNLSLEINDRVLKPGTYTIVIDPIWNEFALKNPEYQKITVSTYTLNGVISRFQLATNFDMLFELLAHSFKNFVKQNRCKSGQTNYGKDRFPEYKGVHRIMEIEPEGSKTGFIYVRNDS